MARITIVALLIAACGTTSGVGEIADLESLTETYGCGTGFWVGNPQQTTALRIAYVGDGPPPARVSLPDPAWDAQLVDGRDLYANWCDDVMEPGEPEPNMMLSHGSSPTKLIASFAVSATTVTSPAAVTSALLEIVAVNSAVAQ